MEESDTKLKDELRKQWLISTKSPRVLDVVSIVANFVREYAKAIQNLHILTKLAKESKNKRERNILYLVNFLWSYEGWYIGLLDLFCAILVINDHDLYNYFGYKFADSPSDIAKVQMDVKEKFLKKHNFGALIRRNDKELRDKIAHHDFSLDEHDDVIIEGKPIDIFKRLGDLMNFIVKTNQTLAECLRKQPQAK